MKTIKYISIIAIFGILTLSSCSKESGSLDDITPASIRVKSNGIEENLEFEDYYIVKSSYDDGEYDGLSHLTASTLGSGMVYDINMLSIYFDQIDKIKTGSEIKPKHFWFSFAASSNSHNSTYEYDGKIILKGKSEKIAVIHFDNVFLRVAFGDYVINGDLKCRLLDKYPWDK